MFESILDELGEGRAARISYSQGTLEIMTPLPEHENDKVIIGDFVKAILEELDIEFVSLGSTTNVHSHFLQVSCCVSKFYILGREERGGRREGYRV